MNKRRFFALLIVLLLAVLSAGCSLLDDSATRELTVAMLDRLVAQDYDACRALVANEYIDEESFSSFFDEIAPQLADLGEYELKPTGRRLNSSNGVTQNSIDYLMTAGEQHFRITSVTRSDADGIAGFHIYPVEVLNASAPSLTMQSPAQWIFLAVALVEIAFIIWMIVDCARRKMRRKWLWLLIIILGGLLYTLNATGGNINFKFNLGPMMSLTSLTLNSSGFVAKLHLPVGALIYLFMRKQLTVQPPVDEIALPAEEPAPQDENPPAEGE